MLADWRIYALASAGFAALTAIFGKIGVSNINSDFATVIRTVVILIFAATIVTFRKQWQGSESIDGRTLLFLILSGLATGASWLCYYRALQLGPASKVAPVDKMSVGITIILAFVFLGESITLKTAVGALLIVLGSIVIVL